MLQQLPEIKFCPKCLKNPPPIVVCCFFHLRLFFFSPSLVVWLNLRLCARNPNSKHAADRAGTVDMLVRSSLVEMVHLFSRGSSTYKSWGLNARMWKSRISWFLQEQKLWFWVFTWPEWEQLLPTAKRCAKAAKKSFIFSCLDFGMTTVPTHSLAFGTLKWRRTSSSSQRSVSVSTLAISGIFVSLHFYPCPSNGIMIRK